MRLILFLATLALLAAPAQAQRPTTIIEPRAQALVAIEGGGMIGVPGVAGRAFSALSQAGHSVSMISQASSEASICFVLPAALMTGAIAWAYVRYGALPRAEGVLYERLQVLTHPEWWVPDALSPRDRVARCVEGRASAALAGYDSALERFDRRNIR